MAVNNIFEIGQVGKVPFSLMVLKLIHDTETADSDFIVRDTLEK